jgi:hypothetical protein
MAVRTIGSSGTRIHSRENPDLEIIRAIAMTVMNSAANQSIDMKLFIQQAPTIGGKYSVLNVANPPVIVILTV